MSPTELRQAVQFLAEQGIHTAADLYALGLKLRIIHG